MMPWLPEMVPGAFVFIVTGRGLLSVVVVVGCGSLCDHDVAVIMTQRINDTHKTIKLVKLVSLIIKLTITV